MLVFLNLHIFQTIAVAGIISLLKSADSRDLVLYTILLTFKKKSNGVRSEYRSGHSIYPRIFVNIRLSHFRTLMEYCSISLKYIIVTGT